MKSVKRLEIVTSSIMVKNITRDLDRAGAEGYTIIPDAQGRGERGSRMNDDLTGVSKNSIIIIACAEEHLEKNLNIIRPILKNYGGICLISDAFYLKHERK